MCKKDSTQMQVTPWKRFAGPEILGGGGVKSWTQGRSGTAWPF